MKIIGFLSNLRNAKGSRKLKEEYTNRIELMLQITSFALCARIKSKNASAPNALPCVSAWTARVRSAAPLIYRPQIMRGRESAWFLLAAVTSNTSFAELGAATLADRALPLGRCIPVPTNSLGFVFANTAVISSALTKRNRQRNPCDPTRNSHVWPRIHRCELKSSKLSSDDLNACDSPYILHVN